MTWTIERDVKRELRKVGKAWGRSVGCPLMYRAVEDAVNLGTFDTFFAADGRCVWIEVKYADHAGLSPKMRPGQPAFGTDLMVSGVRGYVVIGHRDRSIRVCRPDVMGLDWAEKLLFESRSVDFALFEKLFSMGPQPVMGRVSGRLF